MQFSLQAALGMAMLATSASADYVAATTSCAINNSCNSRGLWYTDTPGVPYSVGMNGGCRNQGVPGISWMCVDWGSSPHRLKFTTAFGDRCLAKHGERLPDAKRFPLTSSPSTHKLPPMRHERM
ncbi:hypothetical protein B0T18DRAFT_426914 [Schizothecium vesticola]|uniref:Secreted protein n=1 Tax=Schizothecium vesticola TaxID=314040 RepID=A0AA40F813_9PEZI|nr:hypothetical protein B0T18DRAFT_426914 [Schizothecium vesticola]